MSGPLRLDDYVQDLVLADGQTVHVRPIRPDDLGPMREMWHRLSPETIRLRFFAPLTLDDVRLRHFVEVDNVNRFALVAEVRERIIGVARFDRLPEDPTTADFGITVEDAEQGRGLGTALLGALLVPARRLGITSFHGDILKQNAGMMRVLEEAGFEPAIRDYGDMVTATFTTTPTETLLERAGELSRRAARQALTSVFSPGSIAVVGASRDEGSIGGLVLANLLAGGFHGAVFPVNPHAAHVQSVPAYATLADCPAVPDMVVVCVPAHLAEGVVDQAGEAGVKAAVLVGTGFSESGPAGAALEAGVLRTARRHGIRLLGPNCMGVLNAADGVRMNGTFSSVFPAPGRVGLSSQSGTLGMAILAAAERHGLGLSTFASIGNKVDLSSNDLLQFWEADAGTDVVVLYLESFGNPRTFSRIARRVGRHKPIVVVKAGRRGTDDEVVQAMFDATGVIRVPSLEQMLTVTSLLASQPLPAGERVGVVANGSGPAVLAADACVGAGLRVPELAEELRDRLDRTLPILGQAGNPLTLRNELGPAELADAVRTLGTSGAVDTLLVIFTTPVRQGTDAFATALADAAGDVRLPIVSVFMAEPHPPGPLRDAGLPVVAFPEGAAEALGHVARYANWRRRPLGSVVAFDDTREQEAAQLIAEALGEQEEVQLPADVAGRLLATYGIASAAHRLAADADGAAAALEELGGPVVLKPAAPARKAGLGVVRVGLSRPQEVRQAVDTMTADLLAGGDEDVLRHGWLVQELVPDGVETTLAVTADPTFGPVISVAMGGTVLELLADRVKRVLPLTDRDVDEMLQQLRGYPLLAGHRGSGAVSVVGLRLALLRLSALAETHPEVAEVELEPVFVRKGGVTVVDARVRLRRHQE